MQMHFENVSSLARSAKSVITAKQSMKITLESTVFWDETFTGLMKKHDSHTV